MNIIECLVKAFPSAEASIPEDAILASPNVMELRHGTVLIEAVPAYMVWCAKNLDSPETVSDFTVAALAEYGRCKEPGNWYLNFKFACSPAQVAAVISFLELARSALPFCNQRMVERALSNWGNAANHLLQVRRP